MTRHTNLQIDGLFLVVEQSKVLSPDASNSTYIFVIQKSHDFDFSECSFGKSGVFECLLDFLDCNNIVFLVTVRISG